MLVERGGMQEWGCWEGGKEKDVGGWGGGDAGAGDAGGGAGGGGGGIGSYPVPPPTRRTSVLCGLNPSPPPDPGPCGLNPIPPHQALKDDRRARPTCTSLSKP